MDRTAYRTSDGAPGEAPSTPPAEPATGLARVRRLESTTLFDRGREVVIVHHGQEYRLRITKSGKLILTK
jgi:hemin uptake protein HemP